MEKRIKHHYIAKGLGGSFCLHAALLVLLFFWGTHRAEPGGAGLVADVFLAVGGDGFYQAGVPWGDFGATGNGKDPIETVENKTEKQESHNNNAVTEKTNGTSLAVKKASKPVKSKKVKAVKTKAVVAGGDKSPKSADGTGAAPYGGKVGDASGFGAGNGTGIGIGTGSGIGNVRAARYFVRIRRIFQRRLRYPAALENKKIEGKAVVRFRVNSTGAIMKDSVVLSVSSGMEALDVQALKTVQEVDNLPEPPFGEMTMEIPIVFRVYR